MTRHHRRAHLLLWLLLAPIIAIASVVAFSKRPSMPVGELPSVLTDDRERAPVAPEIGAP